MFAEVILPLPIYSTFTYSIPEDMESDLCVGLRVMVQFGKKKYYTGIIESLHHNSPVSYEVKPIMAVIDDQPAVRYPQIKLWKWIAEYYLCSIGEVYKAAVPTGLKPESETFVTLNQDFESDEREGFSEREAMVIAALNQKKKLSLKEIEQQTDLRNITPLISRMLRRRIIEIDERVVEKYRPKTESFVELTVEREDADGLHKMFDLIGSARKQEQALIAYLEYSGWLRSREQLHPVTRSFLMNNAKVTPGIIKALCDKGIFRIVRKSINRFNSAAHSSVPVTAPLSALQTDALNKLIENWTSHDVNLLHGVTGSGKTEIYCELMARILAEKAQVLYLVPEISLTTQLTDRLRKVFGDKLLVYHSKFSDNERVDIWNKLLTTDEPLIILGARSAVFLPFAKLGLVIIDEEHEASFKQYDPAPRYNARDTAIVLASMHGARVLLGSATPSVETYYKALNGKYGLVTLSERFNGASLPEVEIVDMKDQRRRKAVTGTLSEPLRLTTYDALRNGRQVIMFQNRRGFAPIVLCNQCGWTPKCRNCDVSMIYHKKSELLKCHYCGYTQPLPRSCPACGQNTIGIFGYGTERIAEELHQIFDGFRVARMDLDTTKNKDSHQELIEEFANHETDILVGTQMVSKGLDFANVNVVGVINADTILNFPDFRSNERAFNMLEQVSGRAGRRTEPGKVIIQTSRPDDPVLEFVGSHDYEAFYNREIAEREKYNYPPFTKIINVYIKNRNDAAVDRAAVIYTQALRNVLGNRVLGPEKPFVSRVALWYLQSIMIKIEAGASMKKVKILLREIFLQLASNPDIKSSQIYFDVDPV